MCICCDSEYAGSLERVKESARVAWGAEESNSSQHAKKVVSDSPGLVDFAIRQVNSVLKVARYSFSGSIPPKFEHKLSCHKQRFRKIATTVVSDKDENLLWLGLQWHQSCDSSEMTLLSILLAAVDLIHLWELFPPIVASMFVKFKRNMKERYRDILGWSFYG